MIPLSTAFPEQLVRPFLVNFMITASSIKAILEGIDWVDIVYRVSFSKDVFSQGAVN